MRAPRANRRDRSAIARGVTGSVCPDACVIAGPRSRGTPGRVEISLVRYHRFLNALRCDGRSERGERLSPQRARPFEAGDGAMSGDYSAVNALMVAVLIGLPVMVVGRFGLTRWEHQGAARGSRRERRRLGG